MPSSCSCAGCRYSLRSIQGFFAYDATDELQEVLTGQYVTRHPLLHVLMLGKTVSGIQKLTGSYNSGIGVYVLAQMAIMAMLLGWTIQQLRTRAGRVSGLLFYGLFPVVPMYVLCTSKDTPYTAGMLAVLVLLCRMQRGGCSRREKLKLLLRTRTWYHRQPAPLGQKL